MKILTPDARKKRRSRLVALLTTVMLTMTTFVAGSSAIAADFSRDGVTYGGRHVQGIGISYAGKGFSLVPAAAPGGTESQYPVWCTNMWRAEPEPHHFASITNLSETHQWGPDELDLSTVQLAYILNKYQMINDDNNLAAISYLVHANLEQPESGRDQASDVATLVQKVREQLPEVDALAQRYVQEARQSAVKEYSHGEVSTENQRTGTINNIGVHPENTDKWIPGIQITAQLQGPAVFSDTKTNTWTGTSQTQPISLNWESVGTGDVTYTWRAQTPHRRTLSMYSADGHLQNMVSIGNRPASDPEEYEAEGPHWKVIYDFMPTGTSSVISREINADGNITDTLTTSVDPSYGDGQWLSVDGKPVPVTYRATAYWAGREKPAQSNTVPVGAEVLGSVNVVAGNVGETITANLTTQKRGYVTWVWDVRAEDQPEATAKYVKAGWSDAYGLETETSKENFDFRPIGVSQATQTEVNIDGIISDTLTPSADSNYRDGEWSRIVNDGQSFDAGTYIPVVYRATAYWSGRQMPVESADVPANAEVIGSTTIVANGPNTPLIASFDTLEKRGFVTWVWEVRPEDQQQEFATWIVSGWKDSYALPTETSKENFDFRPIGRSEVIRAGINTEGVVNDTFVADVDKTYRDGEWSRRVDGNFDEDEYIPVVYRATAYWAGRQLPDTSDDVPAGAEEIGSMTVTATEPGQTLNASFDTLKKRGFVTWVWEVRDEDQQPGVAKFIKGGWKDSYGLSNETSRENFDFRPIGVSNVQDAKIIEKDVKPSDTFVAQVDPNFRDGEWTRFVDDNFDEGDYVPVVYTATAYRVDPEVLPIDSADVPAEAEKLGEVKVTANGPGELKAELDQTVEPGFLTWVWSVKPEDQGDNLKWIVADWADDYGIAEETTSVKYEFDIDSQLHFNETKSGLYLVDDVWVSGLPENHPDFEGGKGFAADEKVIKHSMYFYELGKEIKPDNFGEAEKIGETIELPAKNGFYPSVGDPSWKVVKGKDGKNKPGVYVFVSSFNGDDRVKAFTSSATDEFEQFNVEKITSTLTHGEDNSREILPGYGIHKLDDLVPYFTLKKNAKYVLTSELFDVESKELIKDADGNIAKKDTELVSKTSNGEVTVSFDIDGAAYAGKKISMKQTLSLDGRVVAVHNEDLTDENQTLEFRDAPKLKTTATDKLDGDKEIKAEKNQVITDLVCPTKSSLIVGHSYEIETKLIDENDKFIQDENGNDITIRTTFVPTSDDECISIEIPFDGSKLETRTVTVTEEIFENGKSISLHHDLNDKDQTLKIKYPERSLAKTGVELGTLIAISIVLMTIGTGVFVALKMNESRGALKLIEKTDAGSNIIE